jgi:hypothetical protein
LHLLWLYSSIHVQSALREERDKLLAEKAVSDLVSATPDSTLEEAKRLWEAEKVELMKARDDAALQVKVSPSTCLCAIYSFVSDRLPWSKRKPLARMSKIFVYLM